MKKSTVSVLSVLLCLFPVFAQNLVSQSNSFVSSAFELGVSVSPGSLLAGGQKDMLDEALVPAPGRIEYAGFVGNIRWFPLENLGIQAGIDFLGQSTVKTPKYHDLSVFERTVFSLGLVGRLFVSKTQNGATGFDLSAGATYGILNYAKQYSDLLISGMPPGTVLYSIDNGFGYFAKLSIVQYAFGFLYGSIGVKYTFTNNVISTSRYKLDATYFTVPIEIGVYFH